MNYASPEKLAQLADSRQRLKCLLLNKIEVLKERLDTFIVVDRYGKPIGELRNLVLNQRQLSLLIVQPDVHQHWRFVLLSSRLVQQISLRDRVVLVQTTRADISYLPEHRVTLRPASISENASPQAELMAPVYQLPTPLSTDRTHRLEPANRTMSHLYQTVSQKATQTYGAAKPLLDAPAQPKVLADAVDTAISQSLTPKASDPQTQKSIAKN